MVSNFLIVSPSFVRYAERIHAKHSYLATMDLICEYLDEEYYLPRHKDFSDLLKYVLSKNPLIDREAVRRPWRIIVNAREYLLDSDPDKDSRYRRMTEKVQGNGYNRQIYRGVLCLMQDKIFTWPQVEKLLNRSHKASGTARVVRFSGKQPERTVQAEKDAAGCKDAEDCAKALNSLFEDYRQKSQFFLQKFLKLHADTRADLLECLDDLQDMKALSIQVQALREGLLGKEKQLNEHLKNEEYLQKENDSLAQEILLLKQRNVNMAERVQELEGRIQEINKTASSLPASTPLKNVKQPLSESASVKTGSRV